MNTKKPREGWRESFKKAYEGKPSLEMLIPDSMDLDWKDWEWQDKPIVKALSHFSDDFVMTREVLPNQEREGL